MLRLLLAAVCLLSGTARAQERVGPAIERILPLLERAAAGSANERECYTCHSQGLPILALNEARRRGFQIDEENLQRQLDHTYAHLERNREQFIKGEGTGGKADTAGSALWALSAGERRADDTTTAVAEFLLSWQSGDTHWSCSSDRPPSEASDFTTTYLVLRGFDGFGVEAQQERIAARTQSAREWLINMPPQDNEDRAFRLWALQLSGADQANLNAAAADLIGRQHADGGWSQLDDQASDAYATATSLVALHETGSLQTGEETYRRGVDYLLDAQLEDGSWHVVSRSKPFQTYFETGFPHGTDQFISSAASAWAALALLAACPAADANSTESQLPSSGKQFPFEVSETAGIRRRNDVITIGTTKPEIVGHQGSFTVRQAGKPIPAQVRRAEWPGEPTELVVDFIDHFRPLETREYVLELSDAPAAEEPTEGLKLTETDEAYQIDSGGVVTWTIRKDLKGLLDFSWKGVDYIADESEGLSFTGDVGGRHVLSEKPPTRVAVERSGSMAVGLRFDYADWPPGADSTVHLEFPRTKSWIHASWTIDGDLQSAGTMGAALNLRLDGPEALLDFGGGDFVYTSVTAEQTAILEAGPRKGASLPWKVLHGKTGELSELVVAFPDGPATEVHGWAHVMDDRRCTALAVADFGETAQDSIEAQGNGRLAWQRTHDDESRAGVRQLEFWLHFVTMPVHVGARTSPRSMQEPLDVQWLTE